MSVLLLCDVPMGKGASGGRWRLCRCSRVLCSTSEWRDVRGGGFIFTSYSDTQFPVSARPELSKTERREGDEDKENVRHKEKGRKIVFNNKSNQIVTCAEYIRCRPYRELLTSKPLTNSAVQEIELSKTFNKCVLKHASLLVSSILYLFFILPFFVVVVMFCVW